MANKSSRTWISIGIGVVVVTALAYAFWPRPTPVDIGKVARRSMQMSIEEEAKTRVRDAYVVSAPIDGQLLRVNVESGDTVAGDNTIIARMRPSNPTALNARARVQADTAIMAAEAALRVARAEYQKTQAAKVQSDADLQRSRSMSTIGAVSQATVEVAERVAQTNNADVNAARSSIAVREADLANARALTISYSGRAGGTSANDIPLTAPVAGKILRVMQKSETTLTAGTPILEIGDTGNDLEIVAELLSADAVQVAVGNRVVIDNWGGEKALNGFVKRIEPWGFTKPSALGVEEQRVNVIIRFADDPETRERRRSLGHGYRVKVQIIVWEDANALTVPSSALFRVQGDWAVFVVKEGKARLTKVDAGRNNGLLARINGGLEAGDRVIVFPSPGLVDGVQVIARQETPGV